VLAGSADPAQSIEVDAKLAPFGAEHWTRCGLTCGAPTLRRLKTEYRWRHERDQKGG
jgi:hypothetical protein